MLHLNVGSGQRRFGIDREVPGNHPCEFCREPFSAHSIDRDSREYGWTATGHPRSPEFEVPHRFVPMGIGSWLNIDINPKWHPDIVADGAHMPMFANGSSDLIVSHHNLEHIGCGEAAPLIREFHRVLSDTGSLIVCVPNMKALAYGWLQGRVTTQIYMTNVYGAYMDSEADRHRWGYDVASLRAFLLSCGFSRVGSFDWRPIPGSDLARDWWILVSEAFK